MFLILGHTRIYSGEGSHSNLSPPPPPALRCTVPLLTCRRYRPQSSPQTGQRLPAAEEGPVRSRRRQALNFMDLHHLSPNTHAQYDAPSGHPSEGQGSLPFWGRGHWSPTRAQRRSQPPTSLQSVTQQALCHQQGCWPCCQGNHHLVSTV